MRKQIKKSYMSTWQLSTPYCVAKLIVRPQKKKKKINSQIFYKSVQHILTVFFFIIILQLSNLISFTCLKIIYEAETVQRTDTTNLNKTLSFLY